LDRGVYVIGFSYRVVPKDQVRMRVQFSTVHDDDLQFAMESLSAVKEELGV